MMSFKRATLCVLAMTLATTLAFANGSKDGAAAPASSKDQVTLSLTYATGDPLTKETTHEIIQNFQKKYPNIKIVENLSISTGAYLDSLKTLNAAGQFPDAFECRDTPTFVRSDMLAPLSPEIESLFEAPVGVYGKVYTAPYAGAAPIGIVYNKKFFKDNGLSVPKTYSEFIKLCEAIKAKGVAPIVAGVADIWHLGFWYGKFWVDNVGSKNPNWIADRYAGKVHFTDANVEAGMTSLVDLFKKGYVEAGYMSTKESQCVSVLVAGKAAMYYIGPFAFKQVAEADPSFDYGFFALPDDAGRVVLIGGANSQGWALTKKAATDPKKVEAFNTFLKYFFQEDVYGYFLKTTGSLATTKVKPQYEVSGAMADVLKVYNDKASIKCLNWNQGVGANEMPSAFRNWTYKKMQEAMLGIVTVKEALQQMDAEWDVESRDFNPSTLQMKALQ